MSLVPTLIVVALGTLLTTYALTRSGEPLNDAAVVTSAQLFRAAAVRYRDANCTALATQTAGQLATAGYLDAGLLRPAASAWSVSFNSVKQGTVTVATTDRRVGVVLRELGAARTATAVHFPLHYRGYVGALGSGGYIHSLTNSGGSCGR